MYGAWDILLIIKLPHKVELTLKKMEYSLKKYNYIMLL